MFFPFKSACRLAKRRPRLSSPHTSLRRSIAFCLHSPCSAGHPFHLAGNPQIFGHFHFSETRTPFYVSKLFWLSFRPQSNFLVSTCPQSQALISLARGNFPDLPLRTSPLLRIILRPSSCLLLLSPFCPRLSFSPGPISFFRARLVFDIGCVRLRYSLLFSRGFA